MSSTGEQLSDRRFHVYKPRRKSNTGLRNSQSLTNVDQQRNRSKNASRSKSKKRADPYSNNNPSRSPDKMTIEVN